MLIVWKSHAAVIGRDPTPKDAETVGLVHYLGAKFNEDGRPLSGGGK